MTLTNKLKEMRRREEGFTIVELLIVIVVIAILAALVITSYLGIQARARDSERQSDIRAIATAVQAHATLEDGAYPACTAITTTGDDAIENLDQDAINPPNGPSTQVTALTEGVATEPSGSNERYGCEMGANNDGIRLTWWAENAESNPQERILGDYTPVTNP